MKKLITCLLSVFCFLSFNAQCDYTISMQDSYGDGWNGASIDVSVNGITVSNFSIENGNSGSGSVTTYTNDNVEFTFNSGSWDSEITFQINDPTGELLGDYGTDPEVGLFLTHTSNSTCAAPSCPTPTLLGLTVDSESAVATWNNNDAFTSFTLEIGDTGFVQGTGTEYTANDTTYTFTGLSENTYYSFYITSTCGSTDGTLPAGPYTFQTYCNTITTEWSEDWSDLSGCKWNVYDVNGDGVRWVISDQGFYYINNIGVSSTDYLMSPAFTCTDGINDRIRFDALSYYYNYNETDEYNDSLTIGVYDAGVTNFLGLLEEKIVPQNDYNTYEYDLNDYEGQDIRIFIYSGGGNNGVSYIDNIIVDAFPSCTAPTNLSATNTTESTTDLAWTELETATSWNIEFGLSGFVQGDGTFETSSSTNYQLNNLESATIYDVYLQSDCGAGELSDWIGPVTFSTPGTCGFITVELVDAYGDGWNGNNLEILVNSNLLGTYTINTGASANYVIPINTGDIVDLNYIQSGTWAGENGYNVIDQDGNTLVSITPPDPSSETADGPENTVGLDVCPGDCEVINNISEIACDSYEWNGTTYTESGDYSFTGTTVNDCDSIVNLTLTINQSTTSFETINECDSYDWNGTTYDENGTYTFESTNSNGCTLTETLELTIIGAVTETITETACDEYNWNGDIYSQSGSYNYAYQLPSGCDSIVTLNLILNNSSSTYTEISSCDSYDWNGETYTESGMYTNTSQNTSGCIQTDSLSLSITTDGSISEVSACDSYVWNGETYTESGNYSYSSTTGGCEDELILTINNSSDENFEVISCDNYTWNGVNYNESGLYDYYGLSSAGCDSLVTISLSITESITNEINETICFGDSTIINGVTYSSNNPTGIDTLQSSSGCDSIVTIVISEIPEIITNYEETICFGDSVIINGVYYSASNSSGTEILNTSNGCDSTINITISELPLITNNIAETICYGDSIEINGVYYSASNPSGIEILTATNGCDSIVYIAINELTSDTTTIFVSECSANSYDWNGTNYSESGSYSETFQTSNGCDSIVVLELSLNDSYTGAFLVDFDDTRDNFAAPTNLPDCWTLDNTGLSTWTNSIGGYTVLGFNGFISGPSSGVNEEGEYLYVQTYNFVAGAYAPHNDSSIVTTKEVDLSSLTNPELFFNYQLHGEHMGHLSVWINDDNGSTEIFNKNGEMGNTWYEESIDLSDYSGSVSFSLLSILDTTGTGLTAASEMAVDNFEVREQPSCYNPYNLNVDSIVGNTATVSWITNPSITSWNYVLGEPGFDPNSATVMTTTSSTLEIEDLSFASQYEIYVQSNCGTDWEGPLVINIPFPEDYGCTHTLNMFDDYGDGWNGGSIDILVNGATVIDGATLSTGAEGSIEFGAEDGDDISITNFIPGSWPGEISFNVTDGSGDSTLIYSSGEVGDLDVSSLIDTTVSGGCPSVDSNCANIALSISILDTTNCSIAAVANVSGANGNYTYDWSDGQINAIASNLTEGVYTVDVVDDSNCVVSGTINISEIEIPQLILQTTNPTNCINYDGSINSIVSGGTEPYNYSWSSGETTINIESLLPGDYSLTIIDAYGCEVSANTILLAPESPSINMLTNNATNCQTNDGSASVETNILGEYTFYWDNGDTTSYIDSLSGGIYSVIVTDTLGCSTEGIANITSPDAPTIDFIIQNETCYGSSNGIIIATVDGGALPYDYSWNNGDSTSEISNLASADYILTVTDANNCVVAELQNITSPEEIQFDFQVSELNCPNDNNGVIQGTVYGGFPPYSYQWDNGATTTNVDSLSLGEYLLTVTDSNECNVDSVFSIVSSGSGPQTTNITGLNQVDSDDVETYSVTGNPGSQFEWFVTNGNIISNNGSNSITVQWHSDVTTGQVSVIETDGYGCIGSTVVLNVTIGTIPNVGISTNSTSYNIYVYPNPTNGVFKIDIEGFSGKIKTELFDITGRSLERGNKQKMSLSSYPDGIYFIRISLNNLIKDIKIIKN